MVSQHHAQQYVAKYTPTRVRHVVDRYNPLNKLNTPTMLLFGCCWLLKMAVDLKCYNTKWALVPGLVVLALTLAPAFPFPYPTSSPCRTGEDSIPIP